MRVELSHLIALIVTYTRTVIVLFLFLAILFPRDETRLEDNSRKLYAGMLS